MGTFTRDDGGKLQDIHKMRDVHKLPPLPAGNPFHEKTPVPLRLRGAQSQFHTLNPQPTPSLETIVRPFVVAEMRPRDVAQARVPLPGEGEPAFIAWGDASRFLHPQVRTEPETLDPPLDGEVMETGYSFKVLNPNGEQGSERNEQVYTETGRSTQEVKVENPDDPEQYVILNRIESISFRGSDGGVRRFVFNHPS